MITLLTLWRVEHVLCAQPGHGPFMSDGCSNALYRPAFGLAHEPPCGDRLLGYISYWEIVMVSPEHFNSWWSPLYGLQASHRRSLMYGWAAVQYEVDSRFARQGRVQWCVDRRKARRISISTEGPS